MRREPVRDELVDDKQRETPDRERAEGHESDDEPGEGEAEAPGARGTRTPEDEGVDDDLRDRQGEPHPGSEGHVLDERRVLAEDVRSVQRGDAGDEVEGAGDDEEQADELDPAAALAGLMRTCRLHSSVVSIWVLATGAPER